MKSFIARLFPQNRLLPALRGMTLLMAVFIIASTPRILLAQGASPLELGRRIVPDVIGILIGPNFNYASGTFDTGCPCTFTGGFGVGPTLGVMYEKNLFSPSPQWRFGALNLGVRALYEERNISAAFLEYERVSVESVTQRGQFFNVPILFRNLGEGSFSMFTLTPYLSWSPFTQTPGFLQNVYFQAGVQAGFVVSSRIRHTKIVENPNVKLPNGEPTVVAIQIDSTTFRDRKVVEDGPFPKVNQVQIGINVGVGADIPLGKEGGRFRLSPLVQYIFPLTNMSESGNNFRIGSLQVLLGVKMNLQDVSN